MLNGFAVVREGIWRVLLVRIAGRGLRLGLGTASNQNTKQPIPNPRHTRQVIYN